MPRLTKKQELARNKQILQMIADKISVREIAETVSCSNSTVYKVARDNDVPIYKRQKQVKPYVEKQLKQQTFDFSNMSKAILLMCSITRELVKVKGKIKASIQENLKKLAEIEKLIIQSEF